MVCACMHEQDSGRGAWDASMTGHQDTWTPTVNEAPHHSALTLPEQGHSARTKVSLCTEPPTPVHLHCQRKDKGTAVH
eukprot:1159262-Pelagomonas_calceolata.AAC.6